jgi:hypothetical protein
VDFFLSKTKQLSFYEISSYSGIFFHPTRTFRSHIIAHIFGALLQTHTSCARLRMGTRILISADTMDECNEYRSVCTIQISEYNERWNRVRDTSALARHIQIQSTQCDQYSMSTANTRQSTQCDGIIVSDSERASTIVRAVWSATTYGEE